MSDSRSDVANNADPLLVEWVIWFEEIEIEKATIDLELTVYTSAGVLIGRPITQRDYSKHCGESVIKWLENYEDEHYPKAQELGETLQETPILEPIQTGEFLHLMKVAESFVEPERPESGRASVSGEAVRIRTSEVIGFSISLSGGNRPAKNV